MAKVIVVEDTVKANKRELPPGVPVGVWWNRVKELMDAERAGDRIDLADVRYHPFMELMGPLHLLRFKAQLRAWVDLTGEDPPEDVAHWWPVRQSRNEGEIPHTLEGCIPHFEGGTLVCGHCGCRSSAPYLGRCHLCDRIYAFSDEDRERLAAEKLLREDGYSEKMAKRMARSGDYDDEEVDDDGD